MEWIKKKDKKKNYLIKILSKEYLNKKAHLNSISGKKKRKRRFRFKYIFIYDLLNIYKKKKKKSRVKIKLLYKIKTPAKFLSDAKKKGKKTRFKAYKRYYLKEKRKLERRVLLRKKLRVKLKAKLIAKAKLNQTKDLYEEMTGKKKRIKLPKIKIIRRRRAFISKQKTKKIINISFKYYGDNSTKEKRLQKRLLQIQPTFWQNQFYTRYYIRYGMHIGRGHRFRIRTIEDGFVGRYFNLFKTSLSNAAHNILMIRAGLNFLTNALVMGSRLLIISWSRPFFYIPDKIYKYHYFFMGPWKPGSLGNFKIVWPNVKFWYKKRFVPRKGGLGKKNVGKIFNLATIGLKAYPNLLFGFDSSQLNAEAVRESLFSKIPSIFFYNQDEILHLNMTYYPIQGTTSKYLSGIFLIRYVQNMLAYAIAMRTVYQI